MTNETYSKITAELTKHRQGVFDAKGDHYANNGDRLENITNIANESNVTRETAILTLISKHEVVIKDKIKKGEPIPDATRLELLGDIINYYEILNAVMFERNLASNNFKDAFEKPKENFVFVPERPFEEVSLNNYDVILTQIKQKYEETYDDVKNGELKYMEVLIANTPTIYIGKQFSQSGTDEIWQALERLKEKPKEEKQGGYVYGKERKTVIGACKTSRPNEYKQLKRGEIKSMTIKGIHYASISSHLTSGFISYDLWIEGDKIVVWKN